MVEEISENEYEHKSLQSDTDEGPNCNGGNGKDRTDLRNTSEGYQPDSVYMESERVTTI